jgi:hypothetical protein
MQKRPQVCHALLQLSFISTLPVAGTSEAAATIMAMQRTIPRARSDLDTGHEAAGVLINTNLGMAVLVSIVHSVAMIATGGSLAWPVYRYLGLKFVSRSWFNLEATWAFSLISVGALSLAITAVSHRASRNAVTGGPESQQRVSLKWHCAPRYSIATSCPST